MSPDDVLREFAEATADDLGHLVTAASRWLNAELMRRLAGDHPLIRPSHLAVFAGLEPGGSTITALAQHAGISRQAISALVREIEGLGYLSTSADPDDGRAIRVHLTEDGAALCRTAIEASRSLTAEYSARWGDEVLDEVRARLRDIPGGPDRDAPPAR